MTYTTNAYIIFKTYFGHEKWFLTVLKWYVEFYKNLETGLKLICKSYKRKKKIEKEKEETKRK
jgi:hypothetical protein